MAPVKRSKGKKAAAKSAKKTTAQSKSKAGQKLVLDGVLTSGICRFEKRGRKNYLRVLSNPEEAEFHGVPRDEAQAMFAGWFWANNCVLNVGWFWGVKCDGSDDCPAGKTCQLEYWDPTTKKWVPYGDSSIHMGNWVWRCHCV